MRGFAASLAMLTAGAALLVAAAFAQGNKKGGTFRVSTSTEIFDFVDTALGYLDTSWAVAFATCARLYSYGTHMGLTRGWGDVYIWSVEGNYVEFGANQDGLYVVRVISDPERTMHETNVRNNASYAYIKVSGNGIEVLERGYGLSPWDPRKVISNDIRPPTR